MRGKLAGSAWIRLADGKKLFDTIGTFDPSLSHFEDSFYFGPFAHGRYRCQVQINADTFGSTTFEAS